MPIQRDNPNGALFRSGREDQNFPSSVAKGESVASVSFCLPAIELVQLPDSVKYCILMRKGKMLVMLAKMPLNAPSHNAMNK